MIYSKASNRNIFRAPPTINSKNIFYYDSDNTLKWLSYPRILSLTDSSAVSNGFVFYDITANRYNFTNDARPYIPNLGLSIDKIEPSVSIYD